MSDPTPASQEVVDSDFAIEQVIDTFLEAFDEPSDDQVHRLSQSLNLEVRDLEQVIFRMFGNDLENVVTEVPLDQEVLSTVDDLVPQDPIDSFVLAYFLYNPHPTEEQIHNLAAVVGESPEQFEERVYRMMAELQEPAGSDTDLDEIEDFDSSDLDL